MYGWSRRAALWLILAATAAVAGFAGATHAFETQSSARQDPATGESTRPKSDPYKGDLSIFEGGDERAKRLQIERVMDLLGINPGTTVADIGAGSGWFTVRAARRVGTAGTVLAVDINPEFLDYIAERARREALPNIKTVLGTGDDPMLAGTSVDAVLLLKTYHEISKPVTLMTRVRESLRPGGLVGIIDRNGEGDDHGVDSGIVIDEMRRAGFEVVATYDFVKPDDMDYFIVFRADAR